MGKNGKKAAKGKEKTERKRAKAEEKKARRESKKISEEDDIDAILLSIQKEEAKKQEVYVEENVPAPSPRSNCSLCTNPLKESELILYGGEFYNGNTTFVYGHLYIFNVEKEKWKLISSPSSPPPRSAHQAVAWKHDLYIFGGEFTSPNQERFHHYKDFWALDLKTNQWKQINLKGCPSPRSGHRMVLYKHKIIVFGGFYDTLREVRYFNDLYVFDLDDYKWQEVKPTPGCMWPSARSGFQFFVHQEEIFLYGGYSKEVSSDKSLEKGIVHSDMWCLDPKTWEWNKVKKIGMPPGPRAGASMCVYKRRALLFGGVVDMEVEGEVIMSLFLNEIYGFQFDGRRWYPMELRKGKSSKAKSNKMTSDPEFVAASDRTTLELEKANDIVEKLETAESVEIEGNTDKTSHHIATDMTVAKPLGRINCCMVVGRDTLYIYGGMLEVKDQEVTLNDLYALNLSKLDEWKCLIPASESEWIEASEDENEDEEDGDCEGASDNGSNSDETDEDDDVMKARPDSIEVEDVVAMIQGKREGLRRKEKRARIDQIRATLGLSDTQRTPMPGESLKDFYKRTNLYWQMTAHDHFQHTGKELRKDGFDLAETRYRELKPILDELGVLEAEQKVEEAESGETNSRKRGNKQNKKR